MMLVILKSHIEGYTKKDGTVVLAHDDNRTAHSFPSSSHIKNQAEASMYWRTHFGGKTLPITVHTGGREIPIKVRFGADNDHAYTGDEGGKQKTGIRLFDVRRAEAMSRIPGVIDSPKRRVINHGADLFLERMVDGHHYTVVLSWRESAKLYEFQSAHFKSIDEVRLLQERQDRRKNNGPLQKCGPFSAFPDLQASYECGVSPIGVTASCEVGSGQTGSTLPEPMVFIKAHIEGYTKKDGTVVKTHDTSVTKKPQLALFGDWFGHAKQKAYMNAVKHPRKNDQGHSVTISEPSHPSPHETWADPAAVAVFTPDCPMPPSLNGVAFHAWTDHPKTDEEWDYVDGQMDDLEEPTLHLPIGKKAATGCVIEEPDGRIWLVSPTNGFGGYDTTFPKGKVEDELSWQANAIKEVFEESGLKVQITGFLGDFERTTSVTRLYHAKRVGGTPAAVGWESQAVKLVPKDQLHTVADGHNDEKIIERIKST